MWSLRFGISEKFGCWQAFFHLRWPLKSLTQISKVRNRIMSELILGVVVGSSPLQVQRATPLIPAETRHRYRLSIATCRTPDIIETPDGSLQPQLPNLQLSAPNLALHFPSRDDSSPKLNLKPQTQPPFRSNPKNLVIQTPDLQFYGKNSSPLRSSPKEVHSPSRINSKKSQQTKIRHYPVGRLRIPTGTRETREKIPVLTPETPLLKNVRF